MRRAVCFEPPPDLDVCACEGQIKPHVCACCDDTANQERVALATALAIGHVSA